MTTDFAAFAVAILCVLVLLGVIAATLKFAFVLIFLSTIKLEMTWR